MYKQYLHRHKELMNEKGNNEETKLTKKNLKSNSKNCNTSHSQIRYVMVDDGTGEYHSMRFVYRCP